MFRCALFLSDMKGVVFLSIINQVNMCIREIDMIGKSKREARKKGIKGIHSYKTKKECLKISRQFANWVRSERGIRNLYEITEQEYRDFLASKSHTSLDYRRSIETHLRLLQEGLNKRAERYNKPKTYFCPEKRLIPPRNRLEGVSDRSLSLKDINAIKANVSPNTRNAVELMHNMGFRISGAVSLKVSDVNFEKGVVSVIEKGGRYREVPIPKHFEKTLAEMIKGKEPNERLVNVTAGTVQNEVKNVCKKLGIEYTGTHAFRHTYARNRVNELMTKEEKELFEKCLVRYAEGKRFDYGVHDRKLYDSMKEKMDRVHAELGHGKNRFDLALRYMR